MTMSRHIDHTTTHFKQIIPTKIRGDPSYKTLKKLKTELRTNISSVHSNLGRDNHGYLGLIISDPEYTTITGTQPLGVQHYPPALVIPPGSTDVEIMQL